MKRYKDLDEYTRDNKCFFSQPIVKTFLEKNPLNLKLLENFVLKGDKKAGDLLDKLFVEHFYLLRLSKYISTLSHYFSIDFDKKFKKQREKYSLILDHTTEDSNTNLYDFLASQNDEPDKTEKNLFALPESESLFNAIKKLSEKEREILHLLIIDQLKQKDIAKMFGDTPQNIGKMKKGALLKLKKQIDGGM